MKPMYTAEQWEVVKPAFRSMAVSTVEMAHAVLVGGQRQFEVAEAFNTSKQNVGQAIKRVREIIEKHKLPEPSQPVILWLPEKLAEQLQSMKVEDIAAVLDGLLAESVAPAAAEAKPKRANKKTKQVQKGVVKDQ